MNFAETYARMRNDELLQISAEWATLTSPAQAALAAEMQKRNLGNELQATQQVSSEPQPNVPPSTAERVMLVSFVTGLLGSILLPRIWPDETALFGLYEMFLGLCQLWSIWFVVWLVLRFKRVKNAKVALRNRVEELARATERTT